MKYFFYILKHDSGFAPNPFYKFCTLATCKPKIREQAEKGDWIIAFYSRAKNISLSCHGKLIYAMEITERMTYDEYWKNKRFSEKKYSDKTSKRKYGDNIYHKDLKGDWIQEKTQFHNKEKDKNHDTQTDAVLISNNFFYFGKSYVHLPENFKRLVNRLPRGHKYKDMEKKGKKLIKLLEKKYKNGRHGYPVDYKDIENKCNSQKPRKKDSQMKSQGCRSSFKLCG